MLTSTVRILELRVESQVGQLHQKMEEQGLKVWEMETELENFLLENTGLQAQLNNTNISKVHTLQTAAYIVYELVIIIFSLTNFVKGKT